MNTKLCPFYLIYTYIETMFVLSYYCGKLFRKINICWEPRTINSNITEMFKNNLLFFIIPWLTWQFHGEMRLKQVFANSFVSIIYYTTLQLFIFNLSVPESPRIDFIWHRNFIIEVIKFYFFPTSSLCKNYLFI